MSEDRILAAPENAELAAKRFPRRPLTVIADVSALQVFLTSCRASSLVYCGDWPPTYDPLVARLAEWARQIPLRGCGLDLGTEASGSQVATQETMSFTNSTTGSGGRIRATGTQTIASDDCWAPCSSGVYQRDWSKL